MLRAYCLPNIEAWKIIVIRPDLARRSKHCQVDYSKIQRM